MFTIIMQLYASLQCVCMCALLAIAYCRQINKQGAWANKVTASVCKRETALYVHEAFTCARGFTERV